MTDAGLPALPAPPTPPAPQAPAPQPPPVQPVQLPAPPNQHILTQPIQHMPQVNWSHFKPEFAGKPGEDAEAHLLRTNDWMDTHTFQEGVKSPMFLSYIDEGSKIMVSVIKTYKFRWDWVTKPV